jgi:hypothetical protein
VSRRRVPILTEADRLASKKLADRYVNRKGGPPSMREAARAGRAQDLNDDDRKHLKFCLGELHRVCAHGTIAETCLDYVEALLQRDYRLYLDQRRQDESQLVDAREDPELYDHIARQRRR